MDAGRSKSAGVKVKTVRNWSTQEAVRAAEVSLQHIHDRIGLGHASIST